MKQYNPVVVVVVALYAPYSLRPLALQQQSSAVVYAIGQEKGQQKMDSAGKIVAVPEGCSFEIAAVNS